MALLKSVYKFFIFFGGNWFVDLFYENIVPWKYKFFTGHFIKYFLQNLPVDLRTLLRLLECFYIFISSV